MIGETARVASDDVQVASCEIIRNRSISRWFFMSYEHIQHTSAVMMGETRSAASDNIQVVSCESIRTTPYRCTSGVFFTSYGNI